jgi:prevent-host-death family protein
MEQFISTSEANQNFSALMRKVQQGAKFVVTSRGVPVAEISPVRTKVTSKADVEAVLEALGKLPRRSLPGWKREDLYER